MRFVTPPSPLSIFLEVVQNDPDHIALEDGSGASLTYGQLHEQSSHLADRLWQRVIHPWQTIPLLTSSCLQMAVGVLGILKAGCTYVPIDLDKWPQDRIDYVLSQTNVGLIVSTGTIKPTKNTEIIYLPLEDCHSSVTQIELRMTQPPTKESPMCMIFTSGTTNKPKGVIIKHDSVAHLVTSAMFNYDVRPKDRVLLVLSVAFDACMGTLFSTLCNGGTIVLATSTNLQSQARKCSVLVMTPSILEALEPFQSAYPHLDRIILGGETPSQKVLQDWSTFNISIYLAYGPTEATCVVLGGRLTANPATGEFYSTRFEQTLPGITVLLMSHQMQPIGCMDEDGEICIAGPCLSAGYWQDEAATRERFITYAGQRFYRTGDLARWTMTEQGKKVVTFLGREDRIVKIRGFLVNLEQDVDRGLLQRFTELVAAYSMIIDQKLCTAIITPSFDPTFIATWRKSAPSYMVPDHIFVLGSFPMTPTAKVDVQQLRKILSEMLPRVVLQDEHYDSAEQAIASGASWVMQVPAKNVSMDESLVSQGLNSIAAARLSAFCRKNGYVVTVADILTQSSLRSLIDMAVPVCTSPVDHENVFVESATFEYAVNPFQKGLILSSLEDERVNCIQHISYYRQEDVPILRKAWECVVSTEPLFHTRFLVNDGNVRQVTLDEVQFPWHESPCSPNQIEQRLAEARASTGLGSKLHVFHIGNNESIVAWCIHHALIDGFSASLVFDKLDAALRDSPFLPSPPFGRALVDLQNWQTDLKSEADQFWTNQVDKFPTPAGELLVPTPQGSSSDFAMYSQWLELDHGGLLSYARKAQVTTAAVFYAAWALVLSGYTNSDAVVFGAILSGRNLPFEWTESLIGPLINNLPFCVQLQRDVRTPEFVRDVHQSIQQLCRFQAIEPPTTAPRPFTALVVQEKGLRNGTAAVNPLRAPVIHQSSTVPLTVVVEASERVSFYYHTNKFTERHIQDIGAIYANVLQGLINKPDGRVSSCLESKLPLQMQHYLLNTGNANLTETSSYLDAHNKTLTELFHVTAAKHGDRVALRKGRVEITYSMLASAAAKLATVIQAVTSPRDVVVIVTDRSINWIIGVWGVLMANTIYCPVDVTYPPKFRDELVKRSNAKLLLVPSIATLIEMAPIMPLSIAIDQILQSQIQAQGWDGPDPSDAAYLCFTSGSTGVPKGVVVEHRSAVAFLSTQVNRLHSQPGQLNAQFLSPNFDCSMQEIFGTLCYGATLVLRTDDDDPYSHIHAVDAIILNSSVAAELDPDDYPNLQIVVLAGEPVLQRTADRWAKGRKLYNSYGPTESTIGVCVQRLESGVPVNIGPPIRTVRLYILNDHLELQPPNVVGQIFVAGVQLSRGYLQMPDVTGREFISDPYFAVSPSERMYRTGDLGFWDESGNVHCCGRKDRQIKRHGFRLSLDDVANRATNLVGLVRKAVVTIDERENLVLWVEPAQINTQELRDKMKASMPPHAIPNYIMALDKIPQSKNGKIDVKLLAATPLPETFEIQDQDGYQNQELTNIEKEMAQIWQALLGVDAARHLSRSSNFFQMGGHSIMQLTLAARLRSRYCLPITVKHVIKTPVLSDMAAMVEARQLGATVSRYLPQPLGVANVSSAEVAWVLRYFKSHCQTSFNIPFMARLTSQVDAKKLAASLETALNRHRILRSRFTLKPDNKVERSISKQRIKVQWSEDVDVQSFLNRPFNLKEVLLRAIVTPSLFLVYMSHTICDLTSLDNLLQETTAIYHGNEHNLSSKEYFDVTIWNQRPDLEQTQFWPAYLQGLDIAQIPTSRSYRGTSILCDIPEQITRDLMRLVSSRGITVHQVGLAVGAIVLHVLWGKEDILLGSPYMNRPTEDEQRVIGLFLEPLPVRIAVRDQTHLTSVQFLELVRDSSQAALAHAMPWSFIAEALGLVFPSDDSDLFDCVVTFHNDLGQTQKLDIHGATVETIWAQGSKFPMLHEWHARQDGLVLRIEYDTDIFSDKYVQLVQSLLLAALRQMLDPLLCYGDISQHLKQVLHSNSELDIEEVQRFARMNMRVCDR
ncbi:unnamed protein product [Penicillium nalgiovense]|uniref:Carrier domain-containing protein n=1 Tax=Penicillium nalgiovense TaxID=60175 RepID=A0A9W4H9Q9_PENNA|nr:unnamed protein product [Penicillium nalgiovense]CAG7938621.1 unnamed protein product [Penicillium nalgiovense]CAG7940374.1 unnamed protein product [Penicillium nalgiovense]CAG7940534.1 unnamed protein product [Penicillium nalgiovense]CAG7941908.1 unnamed protein product [Penicillium nalgiovense]